MTRHSSSLRGQTNAARAVILLMLAAGCRTDAPVAPGTPTQPGGASVVASVVVTAPRQSLAPGDSALFTAQAFDGSGLVLPTATITWSSSDPSAVAVDSRGLVTAVAEGAATIVATADGQSGRADVVVSVAQLCECTRVLDSTRTVLLQRNDTTGVYVFRIVRAPPPAIDSGVIIVGAQGDGFLRRVIGVARAGDVVTLQTEEAFLEEAVQNGDFATTVVGEGASQPIEAGATRWGEWETIYVAPEVGPVLKLPIPLSGVGIKVPLQSKKHPALKGDFEFRIKEGSIDFVPAIGIGGKVSWFRLDRFDLAFQGGLGLNLDEYDASFTVAVVDTTIKKELFPKKTVKLIAQRRPFATFIGPMPLAGVITRTISLEVTPTVSARAVLSGKFKTGYGLTAGARWTRGSGWSPLFGTNHYFDVTAPTFAGEGTLSLKVAIVPEYAVAFYGVAGPAVNIEPYAAAGANTAYTAAAGRDWEATVALGLNANMKVKLSALRRLKLAEVSWVIPMVKPWVLAREFSDGPLTVSTTVTGDDQPTALTAEVRPDFDNVDPPFGRRLSTSSQDGSVPSNGSVTFENIRSGAAFPHTVSLTGIPGNCAPIQRVKSVTVLSDASIALGWTAAQVGFDVPCIALGSLRVRVLSTGPDVPLRHSLRLARLDTIGTGKGDSPLAFDIPGGASRRDTVIGGLVPASALTGADGRYEATLVSGRRNCAVAAPNAKLAVVQPGDTTTTEFRLACVPLGYARARAVTLDADPGPAPDATMYTVHVTAVAASDSVSGAPSPLAANGSVVVQGLVPVYNASGATGRHTITLSTLPNRCTASRSLARQVTAFPGDTTSADFDVTCVERVHVTTRTTGPSTDGDGYRVVLEDDAGASYSAAVGTSETIAIPGVRPARYTIRLVDVDAACTATPAVVRNVSARDSIHVLLGVFCPGPSAPTNVRALLIESARVDLAWDAPAGAAGIAFYRITRTAVDAPFGTTRIDSVVTLGITDTGLRTYTRYRYVIAAVDVNGVEGPASAALVIRTRDGTPPTGPTSLRATATGGTSATVTWPSASDPESGIRHYLIYRDGAFIDSTTATTYQDGGLSPSTTYAYVVRAANGDGMLGALSPSASATTADVTPPSVPTGLRATPVSMTRIDLAWQASTDPESGVAQYRVYRDGVLVATLSALAFSDVNLTPQTTYRYAVAAVNGAGLASAQSAPVSASTPGDTTPPSQPTGLRTTAIGDTLIALAWNAAADAESGVLRYRVFRDGVLIDSTPSTAYTDGGLQPATTYRYEVSAVNGALLEGARSTALLVTTLPRAPTGELPVITVSKGTAIPPGGYQVSVTGTGVQLTKAIGVNDTVTFANLPPQTYTVLLSGLPAACKIGEVTNPQYVTVSPGSVTKATFWIRCQ